MRRKKQKLRRCQWINKKRSLALVVAVDCLAIIASYLNPDECVRFTSRSLGKSLSAQSSLQFSNCYRNSTHINYNGFFPNTYKKSLFLSKIIEKSWNLMFSKVKEFNVMQFYVGDLDRTPILSKFTGTLLANVCEIAILEKVPRVTSVQVSGSCPQCNSISWLKYLLCTLKDVMTIEFISEHTPPMKLLQEMNILFKMPDICPSALQTIIAKHSDLSLCVTIKSLGKIFPSLCNVTDQNFYAKRMSNEWMLFQRMEPKLGSCSLNRKSLK